MTSATAQSNLKSDLHSAWKQSLNRLTATSQSDSSTPPLQKLVSVGRAWTVVQAHYTTNLQSSDASTVTPTHVVEALNLLSQAGQSTAVSNWYLSYLETQLPERIKILLQPLSTSYQSTSKSNVSSVGVVSQSLVLDLKRYLSPIHQGLFGTSQDQSNLIRIYQTILHSQISKNPSFQTSLLKVLSKSFLTISTSTSDVTSIAIDNKGDGDENRELISNLIILGLGSFLKTKFNTISSEKIKFKVIRLVDDGTWKSKQIPSNHQDESEEEEDGIEGEESIGTSSSSLQALKDWLNETLIPSFRNWIDLIDKLEGENRKQNQNLGFQDGDQGGEVEMELEEDRSTNQIESNEATSKDQISKGMEYQMLKILCEVRSHQLFDLVADWPESKPALLDLKECLIHPELKNSVTKTYSQALKIRLLHPGAGTQDIIQIYVHMIRSLREIDPSGVILSLIVPPIRSYLRGRKDTITVIVSGLIGTGESTLLRQELETPVNNNSKGGQSSVGILESEENVSRSAGIKNLEEYDSDYDDDDFENGIKPDWDDENWFPRPIDAGPNYNQSKNEDIINILITIFDDRLGFIKALEQTTAESLIKVRNYDSTREYRNNIILKRRFGSEAIGHCDVMLADITASRRLDSSIRSLYVNEWSHSGPDSPILPSPHPTCLSIKERETFDNLHPLILSKQFWPEFGNSSSSDSSNAYNVNSLAAGNLISGGGDKVEFPKLGSGLDIGSGKGSENLKMPGQFVKALEVYQHYFSRLKDTRKLKWLLNVGKVKLELEMNDGRVLEEEVTPLQAAVIELASEGSASESNPLSDQSASQILNVEKAAALNALYFWSSKGILRELQNTPGSFEILEGDGEEGKEKEKEKGKDQDEEMTG